MHTNLPDFRSAKRLSIDMETYDPNLSELGPGVFRGDGFPVGISLRPNDGPGFYLPIHHENGGIGFPKATAYLNEQLSGSNEKLGTRLLYDLSWLHWMNVKVGGRKIDVSVNEALLDENRFRYNLEDIAQRRLGTGKLKADLLLKAQRIDPKIRKDKDVFKVLWRMPPEDVAPYCNMDTELLEPIYAQQRKELEEQDMLQVFELESDLTDVLLAMYVRGVRIDIDNAQVVDKQLGEQLTIEMAALKHITGREMNIWAAEDIAKAFDKVGITYPYTAKQKKPSFTAPWLAAHPSDLAQRIVKARRVSKMRNDFINNMVLRHAVNGVIHSQFHQVKHDDGGTVSGRFSSSDPNLQQVPARDPVLAPLIRGLFIPEDGCLWSKHDYSQQEPRLTLHYAYIMKFKGAAEAVKLFNDDPDTDYHQMVASMCGIERRPAKSINLGLAYGMGIPKMAIQLGKTIEETKELFALYHAGVPFVKQLTNSCTFYATTRGYIRTIMGRRRRFDLYLPADFKRDRGVTLRPLPYNEALEEYGMPIRRAFTYKAMNALIQGSAADMIKQALLDMYRAGYVPHITVHDEVNNSHETEKQHLETKRIMEEAIKLHVPLKVESFLEKSWGLCH